MHWGDWRGHWGAGRHRGDTGQFLDGYWEDGRGTLGAVGGIGWFLGDTGRSWWLLMSVGSYQCNWVVIGGTEWSLVSVVSLGGYWCHWVLTGVIGGWLLV